MISIKIAARKSDLENRKFVSGVLSPIADRTSMAHR